MAREDDSGKVLCTRGACLCRCCVGGMTSKREGARVKQWREGGRETLSRVLLRRARMQLPRLRDAFCEVVCVCVRCGGSAKCALSVGGTLRGKIVANERVRESCGFSKVEGIDRARRDCVKVVSSSRTSRKNVI